VEKFHGFEFIVIVGAFKSKNNSSWFDKFHSDEMTNHEVRRHVLTAGEEKTRL
jgi:hypothetical protein